MKETQVSIRLSGPGDAEAMAGLFLGARRDAMPYLPELHTDAETYAFIAGIAERDETFVAEAAGRVVGFAALAGRWLEHLYVEPGWQRQAIGTRLLERAKAERPAGFRLYVFQRNEGARLFYERHGLGLVRLGDGSENEEGEPDAVYEWLPQ